MFFSNGYPYWFFNKILRYFSNDKDIDKQESFEIDPMTCYVTIPFIGKESRRFGIRLAEILHIFDVKVSVIYKTFKTRNYF